MTHRDILALRELVPPREGELTRRWILRCVHYGALTHAEAMTIKKNLEQWEQWKEGHKIDE